VFADFDGCFALTCYRNECRAGICAWCLADCGQDAHGHVPTCREGNHEIYGTKAQFEEYHRMKKETKVKEIIAKETVAVQEIARKLLAVDLKDLGINI
jgi:hypothetical protein